MGSGLLAGEALVTAMAALYALTFLVSAPGSTMRRRGLERIGVAVLLAAFILNTWVIAGRWIEGGRPPFKTMYETMIFYPWCVSLVTLVLLAMHRLYILVPFSAAINLAGLAYAISNPDVEIMNLPPALQSGWFVPHVVTYFVAYAALFASFALALLALGYGYWRSPGENGRLWESRLADYAHQATVFGVVALTLGLVMGAIWGKYAWGDYWAWDPKENWALVSWLAYMAYLHIRFVKGWKGRPAMWILVVAFGAIVFTYLGMNLLPSSQDSLHVYQ